MEYMVNRVVDDEFCPEDNESFKDFWANYLEDFLQSKGIASQIKVNSIFDASNFDNVSFCSNDFDLSAEANQLTCDIKDALDDFQNDSISITQFNERINLIIDDANDLNSSEEKNIVQLTAKICESSALFWKENLTRLTDKLMDKCNNLSNSSSKKRVPWGSVAYADASGALTWGRVGFFAAGGPGGAVACGLAGAAGHSALRLVSFGIFGN